MRGGAVVISGGSHPLDEREIAQLKRQLTEAEADRQSLEQRLQRLVDAAEALLDVERRRSPATEDSSIWLEAHAAALGELVAAVDARRALSNDTGETATVDGERRAQRLNGPMVAKLRRCAADTSPNWDGQIAIYPPEARELVALIDAASTADVEQIELVVCPACPDVAMPIVSVTYLHCCVRCSLVLTTSRDVDGDKQCLKQNNFGRTCILAKHSDEQECRFPARGGAA